MTPTVNILVLNNLADRHLETITNALPNARVISSDVEHAGQHMAEADILVAWGSADINQLLDNAPKLRWVHALSAGVEKLILCPKIQNTDITLTNSRGIHGIPVSEHVFSLMLAFTRGLNLLIRQQATKQWRRVPTGEIYEQTIAIVGLGSIGREIAKKAKCLGMNVIATKREATAEIFVDKLYTPDRLAEMLALADFVVVALPLTEETKELFRLEHFAVMKPTAYFINISRGTVVCQSDLTAALEQKLIAGAGLDVFEHEPLPADSPLWDMSNVIITPHLAALSPYYLDRAIKLFIDNLVRFAQGRDMFNVVDKVKGY